MAALTKAEVERARNRPIHVRDASVPTQHAGARVVPMRPTGVTTADPQDHPQSHQPDQQVDTTQAEPHLETDSPETLAAQLDSLWTELARQGAVVNRIPLDAHHDVLVAKIDHEARRIRALRERP